MAKVLGHGTNYNGKPYTMAKHTKLDTKLITEFQRKYFLAFPAHQRWHAAVASELLQTGNLTTITGRRRWFFGRRNDDTTIREAIAYGPQGAVGDIFNQGMLRIWRLNICQLLLQIHDAILIQYPEHLETEILPILIETIKVPIQLNNGRTLIIPSEAQTGFNWAKYDAKTNPDGLKKWAGNDNRSRTTDEPTNSRLDSILQRVY
jgi:DNA polymerase I-like protein with 3'-5' exonuclease and polymerase domains